LKTRVCLRIAISLAILASGCEVDFEPELTPIDWGSGDLPQGPGTLQPQSTLDPTKLNIPETGTREELLYWADLLGFGRAGRPSIDDYFNPYLRKDPITGAISSGPTPGLLAAANMLYGNSARLRMSAQNDRDNPINFWEDDPLTTLSGNARLDMAFFMASSYNRPNLALFLREIRANRSLYWNYEPAWLKAKMDQYPKELVRAQFNLLLRFAADPELWEWIQEAEPAGPTE